MGNCVSCVSSKAPSNVVKVIMPNGNVQEIEKPMNAAELMLENPQHFVCHSAVLEAGRRISALSADEEVKLGHLYFLLPMHKLHSSLSPSEMASLAHSALHKSNSITLARILPVLSDLFQCSPDGNMKDEINGVKEKAKLQADDGEVRGFSMRIMTCKHWKPALETISESPSNLSINPLLRRPKKGNHLSQSYSSHL